MQSTPTAIATSSQDPDSILKLFDYQQETVEWLLEHPRAILGHDPGLGKTACVLKALEAHTRKDVGPILVVCALSRALPTWPRELAKWCTLTPLSVVEYHGPQHVRASRADLVASSEPKIVTTTPSMLAEVLKLRRNWWAIVVDEAHILRNRDTQWFQNLQRFHAFKVFWWVTGCPVVNSPADLWTALHLVNGERFPSYWRWVNESCHTEHSRFGNQILGVKEPTKLRATLAPYVFRKTKQQVADQLPTKWRRTRPIKPTGEQRRIYDSIARDMLADLGDGQLVLAATKLAQITRLRQVLVTPGLIGGVDAESAAIKELVAFIDELQQPVVVFTPYAKALPIVEQALHLLVDVYSLHGQLTQKEFETRRQHFEAHSTHRKVLLSTIRSAASWETPSASTAVFIGWDWTPSYNIQAEDRLHRLSQRSSVDVWYYENENTIDAHIKDILNNKQTWSNLLLDPANLILPGAPKGKEEES